MNAILESGAKACASLSIVISGVQIVRHLLHYTEPQLQLYIVRILMMIPIYSIQSWLAMSFSEYSLELNALRDIYEAYVLYIFMQLLIQYLGGEALLHVHLEMIRRINHVWPLDSLKPMRTDKGFLRRVKQGVL